MTSSAGENGRKDEAPAYDVRLDPWSVDYGAETPVEFDTAADEGDEVDAAVEQAGDRWQPVRPDSAAAPAVLAFLDGVRRVEARLVATRGSKVLHGAIGSYGVGVVDVRGERAAFSEATIGRVAIFGSGEMPPAPFIVSEDLHYLPRSVPEDDADGPLRGLHREMRAVEEATARRLATAAGTLVIADGPLSIAQPSASPVVGFVKRLFKLYVGPAQQAVLRSLPAGTRTPVFLIHSAGRFGRYSWFIRLAGRLAVESDFTGLVRLEVSDGVGFEEAVRLADLTAAVLPRFVPPRSRDPRAPQNLVPIGALEQHLRRSLGDARLIHRRVATLLAKEFMHA